MARLVPMVKQDTALVAVHWALMRAAQAAGDEQVASAQRSWLATHRGRVFTEATTTEVLRFFNAAVSRQALLSNIERTRPVAANGETPTNPLTAPAARGATQSAGKPH
jgi:hypothetical protein